MRGQTMKLNSIRALLVAVLLAILIVPQGAIGASAQTATTPRTLILYDTTNAWGHLGEQYATMITNLVGHFGSSTAKPVVDYVDDEMNGYSAVIYMGSTWDEPIPTPFLDDVIAGETPVIWLNRNVWQLAERVGFTDKYGWHWARFDEDDVRKVEYKGQILTRDPTNPRGIMDYTVLDQSKISVIAEAVRPDGTKFPWALRSRNLTYVGENPLSYVNESDRYLVFADMLFDLLAPATPERHRALVRLEDVGCNTSPTDLRTMADYLYSQKVPFSFGVYPVYKDPLGALNEGLPETIKLSDRACRPVVSAIKHMLSRGGTMILHGYTHQYLAKANPYNGRSGDDFEFFTAHIDELDYVRYDGPVPEDSYNWALGRMNSAIAEFKRAKLPVPTIWEFPHYAASAPDYRAMASLFSTAYERRLYFNGVLTGRTVDHQKMFGQFFPYVVRDVYGTKVLPENIGNIETESFNHHPVTLADELIARARRNLVVRDGFASFFYHPHLGIDQLRQTVQGIKALGYQFVSPTSL